MPLSYVDPTLGQPDSTEDPKIVTAFASILSWADGVAKLKPTLQTGGTYTAGDGDLVETGAAGSMTITLPDVTAARTVGVTNYTGHGVVVQRAGGATINGPGLGGVTQFALSQAGAFVVLVSDFANWWVVSGGQDTGWVALTSPAGTTTAGAYVPAARLTGTRVELRGTMDVTSLAYGNVVGVTGAGMRPSSQVTVPSAFGPLQMPNGNNNIDYLGSSPYTGALSLDGAFYTVS